MKKKEIENDATDWFIGAIDTPRLRFFGGYGSDYRILDEYLIVSQPGEEEPILRIWKISDIVAMYIKYKKCTNGTSAYDVVFKSKYQSEEDEFFEEIYDKEI